MKRSKKYNISGIYKIQSIKKPERCYIGSAGNIYKRWYYHITRLKRNVHENKRLQNHYNKYGESDFVYSVLLGCPKEDIIKIEQFFLDSYNPYFNICKKAYSSLGRPPWNKGMKGQYHRTKGCFQKGNVPWTKGKSWRKWQSKTPKREDLERMVG